MTYLITMEVHIGKQITTFSGCFDSKKELKSWDLIKDAAQKICKQVGIDYTTDSKFIILLLTKLS